MHMTEGALGTVTFLFSDIEGSTELLKRLGERYEAVLRAHQRLLREAFATGGGEEVDTQGDAFFVSFGRAKNAVAAAADAQRAIARHEWPDGEKVRVRMGIHSGEASFVDGRYVGLAVHRAKRICSAASGGQILLSTSTYGLLADDPLPYVELRDIGERQLKDLDRPERLYEAIHTDLVTAATNKRAGPPRVVVADDSVLIREGLTRLLAEAGFEVVATATDADELLRAVDAERPTVAIIDIKMPPTHTDEGLVAAGTIRRDYEQTGVLVLSQYLDSRYAMRLLERYPERVGYLLKDRVSDVAVLGDAIRRIAEGECVVDPTIVSRLMGRARRGGPLSQLGDDEVELLALIAEGRSDETIGKQLGLALDEVHETAGKLFAKLGLHGSPDELRRIVSVLEILRA
jgi:class 3 adenylate cyclase/DNA-binding NarL/FixJ family response regulator